MAQTSDLGFSPVLHNITPDRVVFCYRANDTDSLAVANHYKDVRSIPVQNIVALPCSSDKFITEEEYNTTIKDPLQTALESLGQEFSSGGQKEIWCIIFGFNVPIAFFASEDPYDPYNLGELIAVASRAHRFGKERTDKLANFTYDRRGNWKYFDADDASEVFITAVINGPTRASAIKLIDRSIDVDNQTFITGKVYVDPYGKKIKPDELQFQNDILDFVFNELPNLGLENVITIDTVSRRTEPTIDFFRNDSFYWGWFEPKYSRDLFLNQNERRVMMYNADNDGAADIVSGFDPNGSDPWCNIAINIEPGYAATAGAVAPPGEDAYLRPRPFFEALHRGASLGEAFLYCSPFIDWKVILIGDPLMVVNFPVGVPSSQDLNNVSLPNNEVILRVKEAIEEGLAYGARQARLTGNLVDTNVASENLAEEVELLYALTQWKNLKDQVDQNNMFTRPVSAMLRYILLTTNLTFQEWLDRESEKTTKLLNALILQGIPQGPVDSQFEYPNGHWQYDFIYLHPRNTLQNVHFELQLALDKGFTNIVINIRSRDDTTGWKYESEPFIFVQLISNGFPSNFSGRKVRFQTDQAVRHLVRTETYYVRWRALDTNGVAIHGFKTDSKKLIVKR